MRCTHGLDGVRVGDKYDGGGMKGAKIYKAEEGRGEARGQRIGSRRINRYKIKA